MKKLLFILPAFAFVLLAGCAPHKGEGIAFTDGSWQDMLNKSKATHKPVFVDIYATWCGPCKMLKNETFTNQRAGDYFNAHFVNASFNGEAGDGLMLAQKFGLQAYPSLYILDSNGSIISSSVGYLSPEGLVAFGKQALNGQQ